MSDIKQAEFFNSLAKSWDAQRARDDKRLTAFAAMLRLQPEDCVLDAGSGTGVLLPYLAPYVKRIAAVDFAEQMLAVAQAKNQQFTNIEYYAADILEFEPGYLFTKISCLNFYPHIKAKEVFLNKMAALLEPGGLLTIMHDISRDQVNGVHAGCHNVAQDRLAAGQLEAERLRAAGFKINWCCDNDYYYYLQGEKLR